MGWLRLIGSLKLQVSSAKEPYKRDYVLQKRPIISRSLLLVATPQLHFLTPISSGVVQMCVCTYVWCVCAHIYMCTIVNIHVFTYMYMCNRFPVERCRSVRVHMYCVCVYVYIYICVVYTYTYVYIYLYAYAYMHMYKVCIYMFICKYIYVYTYTYQIWLANRCTSRTLLLRKSPGNIQMVGLSACVLQRVAVCCSVLQRVAACCRWDQVKFTILYQYEVPTQWVSLLQVHTQWVSLIQFTTAYQEPDLTILIRYLNPALKRSTNSTRRGCEWFKISGISTATFQGTFREQVWRMGLDCGFRISVLRARQKHSESRSFW